MNVTARITSDMAWSWLLRQCLQDLGFTVMGHCPLYCLLSLTSYKGKMAVSTSSTVISCIQVHQGRSLMSLLMTWWICPCVGSIPVVQCVRCSDWPWLPWPPLKQAVGVLSSSQRVCHGYMGTGTFFKGKLEYCARTKFSKIGKTMDGHYIP